MPSISKENLSGKKQKAEEVKTSPHLPKGNRRKKQRGSKGFNPNKVSHVAMYILQGQRSAHCDVRHKQLWCALFPFRIVLIQTHSISDKWTFGDHAANPIFGHGPGCLFWIAQVRIGTETRHTQPCSPGSPSWGPSQSYRTFPCFVTSSSGGKKTPGWEEKLRLAKATGDSRECSETSRTWSLFIQH